MEAEAEVVKVKQMKPEAVKKIFRVEVEAMKIYYFHHFHSPGI